MLFDPVGESLAQCLIRAHSKAPAHFSKLRVHVPMHLKPAFHVVSGALDSVAFRAQLVNRSRVGIPPSSHSLSMRKELGKVYRTKKCTFELTRCVNSVRVIKTYPNTVERKLRHSSLCQLLQHQPKNTRIREWY